MVPPICRSFEGKLIASCQPSEGDSFRDPRSMAAFATAAVQGGAAAIRAESAADINAIRRCVSVPILGIRKVKHQDGDILITPSFDAARELVAAGADLIALDCTARGQRLGALDRLRRIRSELGVPVAADIATLEEGIAAANAGADLVLSTMRGYTRETAHLTEFEPEFIAALVKSVPVPVVAEGRIHVPEQARAAIAAGAFAVVVGTAISRPRDITRWFARAVESEFGAASATACFAAIDLGATNTKFGLVSRRGELLSSGAIPTPAGAGRDALLAHLKRVARGIVEEAEQAGRPAAGVGIATAGWVDHTTGTVTYATENLPGWTGTPIARELASELRLPIAVENDANALALAERHFGAGKQFRHFVCITLGTGVGGGCFIDGRLNRGAHSFANAIGHITLYPDGLPCSCGEKGCLEVYTNAAALLRYAGPGFADGREVIRAANSNDAGAAAAVRTLAGHLAQGCASILELLDPEAIILSGGLAQDNPGLFSGLKASLSKLVPTWDLRNLQILPSQLGYHGGVLGAAAIAIDKAAGSNGRPAVKPGC